MTQPAALAHQAYYEAIYRASGCRDAERCYTWILGLMRLRRGARLLDVACGEGDVVAAGRRAGYAAVGADISPTAIAKARQAHGPLPAVVADAEHLPFADGGFDAVTCLGSVENFGDPVAALAEIHRVLAPGGTFCTLMPNKFWLGDILQVWAGQDETMPFQRVERAATPAQWRRLLAAAGFRVERMRGYVKTSPFAVGGKVRSLRKFLATHVTAAVCPTPLAWSIAFVCRRVDAAPALEPALLWRAEWLPPAPR